VGHRLVVVAAVTCALATACSSSPASPTGSVPASVTDGSVTAVSSPSTSVRAYLPGRSAEVRWASAPGPAPLVVLVPGGGWQTSDPSGLLPLAESLTGSGATTVTITYSTTSTDATYPVPADDVACAVRWSAAYADAEGHAPTTVVLLGHSAGGHLAALVGLSGDEFGGTCPSPAVDVDGIVGLAGVYDARAVPDLIAPFFAGPPSSDPDAWTRGDPLWWADNGSAPDTLRVLLLHGDADVVVPVAQATALAASLTRDGVDVTVRLLPGGSHETVIDATVVAPIIDAWLAAG
jgi:acetyl esterase/lipase